MSISRLTARNQGWDIYWKSDAIDNDLFDSDNIISIK